MPRQPRFASGRLPERGRRYPCWCAERAIFACGAWYRNLSLEYLAARPRTAAGSVAYLSQSHARPSKEASMKNKWIIVAVAALSALLGGAATAAHSYNPMKWIKKSPSPTATEQLAAHKDQEKNLSLQLQAGR